jgi:ESX secretion system protein EccD
MMEGLMAAIATDTGLARVVVVTPKRRLEIALPEELPVAALLPTLLRQGGEDLAIDGLATGGWVLRRSTGTALDGARTLAAQAVLDGEVLHLVPKHVEWPEPEHDDLVDEIAEGARRAGPPWTRDLTRRFGLAVTAVSLSLMPALALSSGAPRLVPALAELVFSLLVLAAGVVLSRAFADSGAGAVVAATALPNGFVGGLLLFGDNLPVRELGAPHLLAGATAVLIIAVLSYLGVGQTRRVFVAGIVAGLAGVGAAALGTSGLGGGGGAAIVVTVLLLFGPVFPILSVRLAKVPMPAVPRDAQDLRASQTLPPAQLVMARVAGSAEILAGLLLGTAVVTVCCVAVLASAGSVTGLLFCATVSACYALRARMLIAVRQRLAPLVCGVLGLGVTVVGIVAVVPEWARLALVAPGLAVATALTGAAAVAYGGRAPSPRLGRFADILDVLLTLAVCPLAAALLGLFHAIRGIAG